MHSVREVGAGWHKAPEQELRSSAPEMALLLLLCCGHSFCFLSTCEIPFSLYLPNLYLEKKILLGKEYDFKISIYEI
jgi:hypothetical protein